MLYIYYQAGHGTDGGIITSYYYNGPMAALVRWPMSRRRTFLTQGYVDNYHHEYTGAGSPLRWYVDHPHT
jgi:hypothetical protein